ncbi:hypothetical protein D3C80_1939440 [compost metagenome]
MVQPIPYRRLAYSFLLHQLKEEMLLHLPQLLAVLNLLPLALAFQQSFLFQLARQLPEQRE